MKLNYWIGLLSASVLAGCSTTEATKSSGIAESKGSITGSSGNTTPTTQLGGGGTTQLNGAPSSTDIPATLKSDAYYYYGLSNSKPLKMEIRVTKGGSQVYTGSQTIHLKTIENGLPVYSIDRSDQLSVLGDQEVRLEKDGIYNIASSVAKIGSRDLEMPANLTPGTTWPSHTEVDQQNQSMVNDSISKVERIEKIKTPVAEREALLVTSVGKGTMAGKKVVTKLSTWFVKDLGEVKTVLSTTYPDGTVQEIMTQEVK